MRKKLEEYYVNSDIKITDPFFLVKCSACGRVYWAVTPIERCALCGSEKISQGPASK